MKFGLGSYYGSARDTAEAPNYPSGYDLPSIVSVAGTDRDAQRAWFRAEAAGRGIGVGITASGQAIRVPATGPKPTSPGIVPAVAGAK